MTPQEKDAFRYGFTAAMQEPVKQAAERLSTFADGQQDETTRTAMKNTASYLKVAAKALDALSVLADAEESPRNKEAAQALLDRLEWVFA